MFGTILFSKPLTHNTLVGGFGPQVAAKHPLEAAQARRRITPSISVRKLGWRPLLVTASRLEAIASRVGAIASCVQTDCVGLPFPGSNFGRVWKLITLQQASRHL